MPSSLIEPINTPARRALVEVFADVPDPRKHRGRRHGLAVILTVAVCAVLAGAKTLLAISEWVGEADREALASNGIEPEVGLPSESTIRRTLALLDADGLDQLIAAWMLTRVLVSHGRRVIALDGKTLRGARKGEQVAPHLLGALDHGTGAVIEQRAVGAKTHEIPVLRELVDQLDITDAVITADALHCQRDTAAHILAAGGHYVLCAKANQPTLYRRLKHLPWEQVPATRSTTRDRGRRVTRTIKAVEAPASIDFPGAAQILQIRRTRVIEGHKTIEVVYVICSVPVLEAQPDVVADWVRGHWGIENRVHWVRDVVFDEDRHQLRTGQGPQVMATLRNTALSLLRLAGHTDIAATLRHHAHDSRRPIELVATS